MHKTEYYKNIKTGKIVTREVYSRFVLEENKKDFKKIHLQKINFEYEDYIKKSDIFFYSPIFKTFFTIEELLNLSPDIALNVRLATNEEIKNVKKSSDVLFDRFFYDNLKYRD